MAQCPLFERERWHTQESSLAHKQKGRTNRMSKPNTTQFKMVLGLAIFFITLLSFIIHLKANASIPSNEPNSIDIQISELMTLINHTVPNVDFTFLNATTSAKNSKATIVDEKTNYCVGDTITVRVEMCNFLGGKKLMEETF
ncbi:unnamed protein product [Ranitomeya imitator]|uniref:Uncharacterized protein n=1 Tax=Ranitomeya imitator TaxID=111125 RepID=A0ABN9MTK6_9NEOB|nr:unnamed protein product [Ranitomeya imitator]